MTVHDFYKISRVLILLDSKFKAIKADTELGKVPGVNHLNNLYGFIVTKSIIFH